MKRKRNFIVSGILILIAGLFAHVAAINFLDTFGIFAIIMGAILFIVGTIVFALNFRE